MKSARKKGKERGTREIPTTAQLLATFAWRFWSTSWLTCCRLCSDAQKETQQATQEKKSKRKRGKYCKILKNVAAKGREEKRGQATAAVKLYEEVSTASGNEAHGQKCQETEGGRRQARGGGRRQDVQTTTTTTTTMAKRAAK